MFCENGCGQESKFFSAKGRGRCCQYNSQCPSSKEVNKRKHEQAHKCGKYNYNKSAWNKGLTKENNESVKKISETLSDKKIIYGKRSGHKHSEETKQKLREIRFENIKKYGNVSFENRNKRKLSSYEKWFIDNIIIKNKLQDKYDIIIGYPVFPYEIDFYFENINLAVEIDGEFHYKFKEHQGSDEKKDQLLIKNNYKVYRIAYFELKETKTEIEFLNFIKIINESPKIRKTDIIKYEEIKKEIKEKRKLKRAEHIEKEENKKQNKVLKQEQKIITKENKKNEREKNLKNLIKFRKDILLNSDIKLNEFGCIEKISKMWNVSHTQSRRFLKKYLSDIRVFERL
jgi:very-short-patch-repair endonuclease